MSPENPACPLCSDNLYVRVEWVISGRRVIQAYYCGHCDHDWQVEGLPPPETRDRRRGRTQILGGKRRGGNDRTS